MVCERVSEKTEMLIFFLLFFYCCLFEHCEQRQEAHEKRIQDLITRLNWAKTDAGGGGGGAGGEPGSAAAAAASASGSGTPDSRSQLMGHGSRLTLIISTTRHSLAC